MTEKTDLLKTGSRGDYDIYEVMPCSVVAAVEGLQSEFITHYGKDSDSGFADAEDEDHTQTIGIGGKTYEYIPWGGDNMLPYHVQVMIGKNMITSQCQQFNTLTCYGQGLLFFDRGTKQRSADKKIRDFCLRNAIHLQFWEQATDMKYYFMSVMTLTLSRDSKEIVQLRHQDVCHCRFTKRGANGKISHVIVANWRKGTPDKAAVYPLLDEVDPLGDLEVRLGLVPDPKTGKRGTPTSDRDFAIVCRVPTVGRQVYPIPYYFSMFLDAWYDIYRLIGTGKRFLIKNTAAPRWQVEIHKNYWNNVCNEEQITDPQKRMERIKLERQNITDFLTKPENAGKTWITSYDTVIDGKETRMVRIYPLGVDKREGGDWSDDMQEASNALCFAMGVHPNMVGATPGKSQMNNSGSDKRELFNLKQAIEKPWHDVMEVPYHVVLHYNNWDELFDIDVPMIEMTTLDQNKEMKQRTTDGGTTDEPGNN